MSRQVGTIGGAVGLGIGSASETLGDKRLAFETIRADVTLVTYDYVNDRLIFKASVPAEYGGKIYEVGLWSLSSDNMAGPYGSRNIITFDSTDVWSAGTLDATNARVGVDALRLSPATSSTVTATKSDILLDFSGNSSSDSFMLAFYANNSFTANVKVRFKTDASNYYEFTVTSPPSGYNIVGLTKSAATVTGTPNWSTINTVEVSATSTAGGGAVVDFDALRIEDTDSYNPDYVLVSRKVLTVPITKVVGKVQEIEYSLAVSL